MRATGRPRVTVSPAASESELITRGTRGVLREKTSEVPGMYGGPIIHLTLARSRLPVQRRGKSRRGGGRGPARSESDPGRLGGHRPGRLGPLAAALAAHRVSQPTVPGGGCQPTRLLGAPGAPPPAAENFARRRLPFRAGRPPSPPGARRGRRSDSESGTQSGARNPEAPQALRPWRRTLAKLEA
eukprot:764771-Hanusia_phi.AAC.5